MEYTTQELHQIAMTTVGKKLEKKKFEFLAVNSEFGKNPQFICHNPKKKFSFVLVRHNLYPNNPDEFDKMWLEAMKIHAKKSDAHLYIAGVGIANSKDITKMPNKNEDLLIKFSGKIQQIL